MRRLAAEAEGEPPILGTPIMSIEAALAELTAAVKTNTDHLARVIAGQDAAMAKLEGATGTTRRTRKAADEAPATAAEKVAEKAAEPAAEKTPESTPTADAPKFTQDDLKAVAMEWRNSTTDEAARKKQNELFVAIAAQLGVSKMTGPEGPQDSDQIKQAVFYIRRAMAGLSVDFGADYDFDGAPDQGAAASAPAEEDPFA